MSQNIQNPYFYTLDGGTSQTLEVVGATSVSVFSETDTTAVTNMATSQVINIPIGNTLDLNPNSGCTLATLRIIPASGFAYVVMIGGVAKLV
jgi:hypothetical protein